MPITQIASGVGGQLLGLPEVTFGVAPTLTSPICWEFNSETLALKKNTVQGRGLHAGGRFDRGKRRVLTNYDAGGGVDMDLPTRNLNTLLKAMMGSADVSKLATNGTLVTNGEATTPSFTAQHIPGSNIGYSLCLQKGVPTVDGVIEPFTYVGCKVADWSISVAVDQIAKLQLTLDARNELAGPFPNGGAAASGDPLNAATPALATWTNVSTGVFHFREAVLLTGGTATTTSNITSISAPTTATNVKNCTVKVTNPIANKRINLGTSGFKLEQVDNGFRTITGSFEVEWLSSEAMYAAFAGDTPTALQLNFAGLPIGTPPGGKVETLNIMIPYIKLDGESPQIPSPDIITQKVTFSGLDDEVNNPIQITYTTLDTV